MNTLGCLNSVPGVHGHDPDGRLVGDDHGFLLIAKFRTGRGYTEEGMDRQERSERVANLRVFTSFAPGCLAHAVCPDIRIA